MPASAEPAASETPGAIQTSTKLNELNLSLVAAADISDYENASGTVTYTVNGVNLTHALYKTMEEANAHPFVCYANDDCFPIPMQAQCFKHTNSHPNSIQGYGITCTEEAWSDWWTVSKYYATIIVKPFLDTEAEPSVPFDENGDGKLDAKPSTEPDVATSEEPVAPVDPVLAEKTETLLGALDLTVFDGLEELCRQDLLDFLSGDWDGTGRTSHDEGYSTVRTVYARVYTCVTTDDTTGKSVTTATNLDYMGELEVLAVLDDKDDFSLAVDNATGLVEQWSWLEKLNSWQVTLSEGETVDYVLRMIGVDDQIATVSTTGPDDRYHAYSLMANGDVVFEF